MPKQALTINECKSFSCKKINKSLGYDDISFNVIKKCFGNLCEPLKHIFDLFLHKEIFSMIRSCKITPIFKSVGKTGKVVIEQRQFYLVSFLKLLERKCIIGYTNIWMT